MKQNKNKHIGADRRLVNTGGEGESGEGKVGKGAKTYKDRKQTLGVGHAAVYTDIKLQCTP